MAAKRNLKTANMRSHSMLFLLASLALIFTSAANAVRIVSQEELAGKVGKDGDSEPELWLSILGEVYDVSSGAKFYGEGGPYGIFAGRDGSVPFITGTFTPEEALKGLDVLDSNQLNSLDNWRKSYEDNEKYPFVGLLEGRLYDKDGNPTEELIAARVKMAEGKVVADERKKKRDEVIAQRKKERLEKEEAQAAAEL
jgi:predicted heme/steroid binding protein